MKKIILIGQLLYKPKTLKTLLSLGIKGYLKDTGWLVANEKHESVDEKGAPVPWLTYPIIDFLKLKLNSSHTIFEYGSGNSTLFYGQHVQKVVAVEHDKNWFEKIKKEILSNNVEINYVPLDYNGEYASVIHKMSQDFDIVIVDGRDRVNCCKQAINKLSLNGVIILDDSEREQYNPARQFLLESGMKELFFSGIAPGTIHRKMTSIFYRSNNCLSI